MPRATSEAPIHERSGRDLLALSGIQQFGGEFYVEPLFNGVMLLVAIGIAGYSQRRRRLQPTPSKPTVIGSR